jgi:hypothetical protein
LAGPSSLAQANSLAIVDYGRHSVTAVSRSSRCGRSVFALDRQVSHGTATCSAVAEGSDCGEVG